MTAPQALPFSLDHAARRAPVARVPTLYDSVCVGAGLL